MMAFSGSRQRHNFVIAEFNDLLEAMSEEGPPTISTVPFGIFSVTEGKAEPLVSR